MGLTLYCALLDNNGNLNLGYKKIKNKLSLLVSKAIDQNIKESEVIKLMNEFLYNYDKQILDSKMIVTILSTLQNMVSMYLMSIQYYTMIDDETLLNNFLIMFTISLDLKSNSGSCYNFVNSSIYTIDEYIESIPEKMNLGGTSISRIGYLKKEASTGIFNTEVIKDLDNVKIYNEDINIAYNIKEIVSEDGIIIVYYINFLSFFILAVEDYITNKIYLYQHFVDSANVINLEKNMQLIYKLAFTSVREYYITKLLKNERNLTDKVEVYSKPIKSDKSGNFIVKKIMIAPYKRKLPKDSIRSNGKEKDALKFNIILNEDETFVNSFLRNQKYKNNKLTDTDLVNFDNNVRILPKQNLEININKTNIFSQSK